MTDRQVPAGVRTTCNSAEYERLRARCARLSRVARAALAERAAETGTYEKWTDYTVCRDLAIQRRDAALAALEPEDTADD